MVHWYTEDLFPFRIIDRQQNKTMPLKTEPCQKFVEVVHIDSGVRKPATVRVDGVVVDKDGPFDQGEWAVSQSERIEKISV